MNENEVTAAIEEAEKKDKEQMAAYKEDESLPKHVKSIKSQYDFKRNRDLNMAQPTPRPHTAMLEDLPHLDHQGENPNISNEKLRRDDLMEEISKWKRSVSNGRSETTTTERIIKALSNVEEAIGNHAPEAGELKKKSKQTKQRSGIELNNVTATKRERTKPEVGCAQYENENH
jgi:hypothetical protein